MSDKEVDRLVERYYYLVDYLARRPPFARWSWSEDLLQAGRMGLVVAAMRWDRSRPFVPFAKACIRNAMRNWVRRETKESNLREGLDPDELADELPDPRHREDNILERLAFQQKIDAAFAPNSRERYILTALSKGQSKAAVAAALGMDAGTVQRIAEKAYEEMEKQGAPE